MKNISRKLIALALGTLVGMPVHAMASSPESLEALKSVTTHGSAGAAAVTSSPAAGNSSSSKASKTTDAIVTQVAGGLLLALGGYVIKDIYDFFKGHATGTSDLKTTQLAQISGEIKREADKIAIVHSETAALHSQYNNLVMLFNGGINTGLDKKEIQAEIKKVWEAIKCNSTHSALVIQEAKEKIRELEGKRDALSAPKLSSLKETTLPTEKRRITPALAAQGLAAQRSAAA